MTQSTKITTANFNNDIKLYFNKCLRQGMASRGCKYLRVSTSNFQEQMTVGWQPVYKDFE